MRLLKTHWSRSCSISNGACDALGRRKHVKSCHEGALTPPGVIWKDPSDGSVPPWSYLIWAPFHVPTITYTFLHTQVKYIAAAQLLPQGRMRHQRCLVTHRICHHRWVCIFTLPRSQSRPRWPRVGGSVAATHTTWASSGVGCSTAPANSQRWLRARPQPLLLWVRNLNLTPD